jgi:hypothetical protein
MRSLKTDRSSNIANHSPIRWAHQNRDPHGFGVPSERSLFAGVKGQVFVRGVDIRIF